MGDVKRVHEFRDPLHDFIELNRQERSVVDSVPFQRLRHIHQLALSSLVYPGATHTRFEHSLGVMHLAKKVFDIVTSPQKRHPSIAHIFPDQEHLPYWRSTVAIAALLHDVGHLPFSHAAEKKLLPKGEDHESLTLQLIDSDYIKPLLDDGQKISPLDVQKLSIGKKKLTKKGIYFSDWEAVLSEIVTGNAFGVDRIDYLLRDSFQTGTSYGKFDHKKLLESLRILPASGQIEGSSEPSLGVDQGGLHSAEALLLARYFMYEQVYFHPVRRSYDWHLIEFMKAHYESQGGYNFNIEFHLKQTDNEVNAAIRRAAFDESESGHVHAAAILFRRHDHLVYTRNPSDEAALQSSIVAGKVAPDIDKPLSPAYFIHKKLSEEFGSKVHTDLYIDGSNPNLFPVLMPDGRIESSISMSSLIGGIPPTTVDYIFCEKGTVPAVQAFINENRDSILKGEL